MSLFYDFLESLNESAVLNIPNQVIKQFEYNNKTDAHLDLQADKLDSIQIMGLTVNRDSKGQGHAEQALNQLNYLSDKMGVILKVDPTSDAQIRFYSKYGFKWGKGMLRRMPKSNKV